MNEQLVACYATPGRHYHTFAHVEACLRELDDIGELAGDEREILRHALLWHDAVHDPRRSDNEAQSAALAKRNCDPAIGDEVARLVLLTKDHGVAADDRLGAIMVSIDLSVLGAPPDAYRRYAAQIRQEYAHVPADQYRVGRAGLLAAFLQRPVIYPFAPIRSRLESAARANIRDEIRRLAP